MIYPWNQFVTPFSLLSFISCKICLLNVKVIQKKVQSYFENALFLSVYHHLNLKIIKTLYTLSNYKSRMPQLNFQQPHWHYCATRKDLQKLVGSKEALQLKGGRYSLKKLFSALDINNISTVQSRFSDIKFSDNLWFSDYFTKTVFHPVIYRTGVFQFTKGQSISKANC